MKPQYPLKCIWRNASTNEQGQPDRPEICKMRECPGEFRNAKEVKEFKCRLFREEMEAQILRKRTD